MSPSDSIPLSSVPIQFLVRVVAILNNSIEVKSKPVDPFSWPFFGTVTGLSLLGVFLITCCLCCCYYWYVSVVHSCRTMQLLYSLCTPVAVRAYKKQGRIELYHIERCTDPDCHCPNSSSAPSSPSSSVTKRTTIPCSIEHVKIVSSIRLTILSLIDAFLSFRYQRSTL